MHTHRAAILCLSGMLCLGTGGMRAEAASLPGGSNVGISVVIDDVQIPELLQEDETPGVSLGTEAGISSLAAEYSVQELAETSKEVTKTPGVSIGPEAGIASLTAENAVTSLAATVEETPVTGSNLGLSMGTESGISSLISEAHEADPETDQKIINIILPYKDLCIAQVDNYVNVRSEPDEESEILGKLYDDSAGTVLEETDGWYLITSGNVTGYVKAEYVVTGEEAEELAKEVGTQMATVLEEEIEVKTEEDGESETLEQVAEDEDLLVLDEDGDWIQVSIGEETGWVRAEDVEIRTDFVMAESKEEEEARLAEEAAAREAARQAATTRAQNSSSSYTMSEEVSETIASDSGLGSAVVTYASQFVGNPYVWGGTSLTNGTDCSGFVLSVYSHFGISLPHSSSAMRSVGYAVSPSEMQPGDIICYSGHVAIYCGNNTIVHASSRKTGIKYTTPANYANILAIRRIF